MLKLLSPAMPLSGSQVFTVVIFIGSKLYQTSEHIVWFGHQ